MRSVAPVLPHHENEVGDKHVESGSIPRLDESSTLSSSTNNANNQCVVKITPDFTPKKVKPGVLFLYAWNKPSNELEFHRLTPRLCLQGRPSSVADLRQLKIHSDGPSQVLQCSKYTISGCRGFCSARNTLFLAAADFAAPEIHYFWPSQICNNPSLCSTAFRTG